MCGCPAQPDKGILTLLFARYSVVAAFVAGNSGPGPEEGLPGAAQGSLGHRWARAQGMHAGGGRQAANPSYIWRYLPSLP